VKQEDFEDEIEVRRPRNNKIPGKKIKEFRVYTKKHFYLNDEGQEQITEPQPKGEVYVARCLADAEDLLEELQWNSRLKEGWKQVDICHVWH
jgi:hypothetical protein